MTIFLLFTISSTAHLLNKQVKRALSFSIDEVREDLSITFVNVGDLPQDVYNFLLPEHLSVKSLTASASNGNHRLEVEFDRHEAMHARGARIRLSKPIHPEQSMTMNVQVLYESHFYACPKYSAMDEVATFKTTHNAFFYSEYPTQKQRTYLKYYCYLTLDLLSN